MHFLKFSFHKHSMLQFISKCLTAYIMGTVAKVYDELLLNRLILWSSTDKCQAGAQKGRGCIEQIMTLRLLIDLAKHKKERLYVLFIDFSKAYDKVPRNKLVEYMKSIGCGREMLQVLKKCIRAALMY